MQAYQNATAFPGMQNAGFYAQSQSPYGMLQQPSYAMSDGKMFALYCQTVISQEPLFCTHVARYHLLLYPKSLQSIIVVSTSYIYYMQEPQTLHLWTRLGLLA